MVYGGTPPLAVNVNVRVRTVLPGHGTADLAIAMAQVSENGLRGDVQRDKGAVASDMTHARTGLIRAGLHVECQRTGRGRGVGHGGRRGRNVDGAATGACQQGREAHDADCDDVSL